MGSSKITQLHVFLIGGVVMLLLGVGLFFTLIKPIQDENKVLVSAIGGLDSTTVQVDGQGFNLTQVDAAQTKLEGAEKRRDEGKADLARLKSTKQLSGGQQLVVAETEDENLRVAIPRWVLLPRVVVQTMSRFVQRAARKHGVTVQTQFGAPAPTTNPADIPRDLVAWNLGPMNVTGDFNRVMGWAKEFNNAPLLSAVEGLKCQLAGRNGRVQASATLTTYVFPTGKGARMLGASTGGSAAGAGGMGGAMGMGPMGGGTNPMPFGTASGAGGGGGNSPGGGAAAPGM